MTKDNFNWLYSCFAITKIELAEKLRGLTKQTQDRLGLNQGQLAERLQIKSSTLSDYLNGDKPNMPKADDMGKLIELFEENVEGFDARDLFVKGSKPVVALAPVKMKDVFKEQLKELIRQLREAMLDLRFHDDGERTAKGMKEIFGLASNRTEYPQIAKLVDKIFDTYPLMFIANCNESITAPMLFKVHDETQKEFLSIITPDEFGCDEKFIKDSLINALEEFSTAFKTIIKESRH